MKYFTGRLQLKLATLGNSLSVVTTYAQLRNILQALIHIRLKKDDHPVRHMFVSKLFQTLLEEMGLNPLLWELRFGYFKFCISIYAFLSISL